ncbi:MAG: 4-hydroxyphenylacetate 3-hydroxylase family protein [Desulfobacterales bacterium]|nr:4-hydroxyphenylacetate 3-hydroxylase family protein [Desulfobacterales bacterium]
MALMTGKQYIESLRKMALEVYFMGEKITSVADEPMFQPHIHTAAMTYELAGAPEHEEIMTATSHLTGEKVNRFTHIHQSIDDLVKKIRMMRLLGQKTGTCFQRCVGLDALNALYCTTFDMDQKNGSDYHDRFRAFLSHVQQNDLMSAGAMTDPRGDRSLRPSQQKSPNAYLHISKRTKDGIVVNGAKAHITGVINSHEIIALPTRAMGSEDADFAVAFAIPVDTPGIRYIFSRQTNDSRRLESPLDAGNPKYAIVGGEAVIVFNDVFVPWELVFMAGEYEFCGPLVESFAGYHRSNYGGCKVGLADVVIGASHWIADAHGVGKASHIVDKLTEMIAMAETCWSCSLACSYEGHRTPSGAYSINPMLANVTKLNITRMVYEWMRVAQDIAGGKIITLPSEHDLNLPENREVLQECFRGKEGVQVDSIFKMLRLIENMSVGAGLPEAMHGAGSPAAQKIMIARRSGIERKRLYAEIVAGIVKDEKFETIVDMPEEQYWAKIREKMHEARLRQCRATVTTGS